MKKTVYAVLFLAGVCMLAGCASIRPDWVKNMSKKGTKELHYEVGYGKMSSYDTSLKRAQADAVTKIARWVRTDVESVLSTYQKDSGIENQQAIVNFMEEVTKQVADLSVSGASTVDAWEDKEGGVYILVSYPIENVAAALQDKIRKSTGAEAAKFNELNAAEAFKALQENK